MFERYTEKARRVLFFARYEASAFGSRWIEPEHLFLGIVREEQSLARRFLGSQADIEGIRNEVRAHLPTGDEVSLSADLPLSHGCKQVLNYAADESKKLRHVHIGTEHLLLALLREEDCFVSKVLQKHGLSLADLREQIMRLNLPDANREI